MAKPTAGDTPNGRKIVELLMDGGELVWVAPLSFHLVIAIRNQVRAKYPEIDEAPYHVPLDGAMVPGDTYTPPENQQALESARLEREQIIQDEMRKVCISLALDSPQGKARVIERYAADIERARDTLQLEGDDWFIAANYFVVQTENDLARVMPIVNRQLPLGEVEVANGLLVFRPQVRGRPVHEPADSAPGTAGDESPSGTPEAG